MTPVLVNHVGLCCSDLAASTRFYVELLGFEVERELTVPDEGAGPFLRIEPPVGLHAVYLRLGDFVLELMAFDRPGNPEWTERVFNEPGLTHLSLSVGDLDDVLGRVEGLGGAIVTRVPHAAVIRDPGGQLVELLPMSYRESLGSR
jgi:lactoylglutathione lyase